MQRVAPAKAARAGGPWMSVAEKSGPALRDFTNYARQEPAIDLEAHA